MTTPTMLRRAIPLLGLVPKGDEWVPWTDRRGRFSWLRGTTFALLLAPLAWLLVRWAADMLGPRATNTAIHSTGYTAVWILLASLAVTPMKALAALPNIVVIRRMIGNAALLYALLHLSLYASDQKWKLLPIATEIVSRFYLTIGFAALLGLLVLGSTSTDAWIRHLGATWKRLHRIVYPLMALGLFHYVLQSKLDVSQALLAAGVFSWLMLWRALPAGQDREWRPLLAIAFGAALLTVAFEYGWYRFGTKIDPMRVIRAEFDVQFGLHPAGQVLALGALVTFIAELRRLSMTAFGGSVLFTMLVYGLGALLDDLIALSLGWSLDDLGLDAIPPAALNLMWCVFFSLLGAARWKLRRQPGRHWIDGVWIACIAYQLVVVGTGDRSVGIACAWLIVSASLLLGRYVWTISRGAALMLIPPCLLLAYEAASIF